MTTDDGRTMHQRMLAGDPYRADDPVLVAASRRAMALTDAYNRTSASDVARRRSILEHLLGSIGEDTEIRAPFHCDYGTQIHVGSRTFANFGLVVLDVARVTVGDDVQIGPRVQLLAATHPVDPEPRRAKWESGAPVTIGDNVWLGGGVVVCPGVTVGADTVVAAGAVVTRDLPPQVLAAGVPARVVRPLAGR